MSITIKEIETLKPGDYLEAADVYYKVLKINVRNKSYRLSKPFERGKTAEGSSTINYTDRISRIEHQYWSIIRKNSKEARGLEKKLKQENYRR